MERHYAVLQKKLEELEALLQGLLSHPSGEVPCGSPSHQLDHQEIQARLSFLKTLLASEMEVNPESASNQLHEIADGLAALEDTYHSLAIPDRHHGALSSCSCTSSCLNEEEEENLVLADEDTVDSHRRDEDICGERKHDEEQAVAEEVDESAAAANDGKDESCREIETLNPGCSVPLAPLKNVEVLCSDVSKETKGRENKQHRFRGRKCGVMGTVVLAVAAVTIVAEKFWAVEEAVYLAPT